MEHMSCPQEVAVSKSARSGEWGENLRQHVAGCSVCGEVLRASLWMQSLAQEESTSTIMPDPSMVWQRARLNELLTAKEAKVQTSLALTKYVEAASLALALITLTSWAAWNWQLLDSAMGWLSSTAWTTFYEILNAAPTAFWSVIGVFSLIAVALVFPIAAID